MAHLWAGKLASQIRLERLPKSRTVSFRRILGTLVDGWLNRCRLGPSVEGVQPDQLLPGAADRINACHQRALEVLVLVAKPIGNPLLRNAETVLLIWPPRLVKAAINSVDVASNLSFQLSKPCSISTRYRLKAKPKRRPSYFWRSMLGI